MKYLKKTETSEILKQNLRYKSGNTENNRRIRELLVIEQNGYCAYTEKKLTGLDSVEVEHFNPVKKNEDDYYNYYSVIRRANQLKTRTENQTEFQGASFFESRFFQSQNGFEERIAFIPDDLKYEARSPDDKEAKQLINYLNLNDVDLITERRNQIIMLNDFCGDDSGTLKAYLKKHPERASFPTAIEAAFNITLSTEGY